jgi:hypothetical protein
MNNARKIAEEIAGAVPDFMLPRLLSMHARGTKKSIHRDLRALVRDNWRFTLTPEMEGRVANQLAKIWKIKKNRRRNANAESNTGSDQ